MPDFWIFLNEMTKTTPVGYMVVLVLAALAWVMIKSMTNSTWFTLIFTGANIFGAFAGMQFWKYSGVVLFYSKEPNLIVGACIGMLVAFLIMLAILRVVYMVLESRKVLVRTDIAQQE